jgi:hypothetical protein
VEHFLHRIYADIALYGLSTRLDNYSLVFRTKYREPIGLKREEGLSEQKPLLKTGRVHYEQS